MSAARSLDLELLRRSSLALAGRGRRHDSPHEHTESKDEWEGPRCALCGYSLIYRPGARSLVTVVSVQSYRFVVFVEMRLELGHSLIPALHVPLTHLRAEHARGSCGMSAARASQSGPQPTTQHGCMPASRRRLAGRLPGRSNPTAGGRHEPSMAPSGHEAIHAKPCRPTCATSLHAIGALLIKQCVQLGSRRSLVHRFSCAAASGSRPPAGAAAP
jgi:hypothetical protein